MWCGYKALGGRIQNKDMSNRNVIFRGLAIYFMYAHLIFATTMEARVHYSPIFQSREDTVCNVRSQELKADTLFNTTHTTYSPKSSTIP